MDQGKISEFWLNNLSITSIQAHDKPNEVNGGSSNPLATSSPKIKHQRRDFKRNRIWKFQKYDATLSGSKKDTISQKPTC